MTRPESAAEVFDAVGQEYETAFGDIPGRCDALGWLLERLPEQAKVLDLGSGTGSPTAERIAARGHDVTGCDVSSTMVEIAKARVPAAHFEIADMGTLSYPLGSWDAVTAFFSMLQMTRPELDALLARIAGWVAPGGHFVLGTIPGDVDGLEFEFLGHPIRASSYPADVLVRRLTDAGLEIVYEEHTTWSSEHPGVRPEDQLYLIARKPS